MGKTFSVFTQILDTKIRVMITDDWIALKIPGGVY
jgi:hypothetical protein